MTDMTDRGSGAGRVFALVVAILAFLAFLPAGFAAMMSVMMFDAPGSDENGLVWALVLGMWAAPLVCVATGVAGLIAASRFTRRRIAVLVGLPVVWFAYMALMVMLLESNCGGQFSC